MCASLSEQGVRALAVLASEWFKTARRLSRLTQQAAPAHAERERAQLAYSKTLVEDALAENGIRLVIHECSATAVMAGPRQQDGRSLRGATMA